MPENFIYEYRVEWYDEIEERAKRTVGLTWGSSYTEAMTKVANYFGDASIISACLVAWDTEIIQFDEDTLMYLRKENVI